MSILGKDHNKSEHAVEVAGGARMVPRIAIQAFCENSQTAQLVETAIHDRRMSKVALTTHNGGLDGAVETYRSNPTPNLIMIETSLPPDEIPVALEQLAEVVDAGTRVIVLGHVNDVVLYRDLIRNGVSEYIVLPTSPQTIVDAVAELFVGEDSSPVGRSIGFISAKGGAGSSTVAHNVSWAIAQHLRQDVLILDMDLAFGTAGLDFNQDPPHGLADAVFASEKIDQVMLDRLIAKAANHVSLLAAPGLLDKAYDMGERDFEPILELAQRSVPVVVLDIPHIWDAWVRHTLSTVDEIVIVAEPDLANLRNAKNLADTIRALRPSDSDPGLLLNRVGVPKRPEIAPAEFAGSINCNRIGEIPYDPALFGTASNNGQMIAEVSATHRINEIFRNVGYSVTGRSGPRGENAGKGGLSLPKLTRLLKRA
ncbi:MAG TPA: AAA family ATPase [Devosiaceae bacterium]